MTQLKQWIMQKLWFVQKSPSREDVRCFEFLICTNLKRTFSVYRFRISNVSLAIKKAATKSLAVVAIIEVRLSFVSSLYILEPIMTRQKKNVVLSIIFFSGQLIEGGSLLRDGIKKVIVARVSTREKFLTHSTRCGDYS